MASQIAGITVIFSFVYNKEILKRMSPMIPKSVAMDVQIGRTGVRGEIRKDKSQKV